jgi:hypothetical protein
MPVMLKDIKKELQSDRYKKGKNKDGSYKYTPPSLVSRKLSDYTNLKVSKFDQVVRQGVKAIDYSGMVNSEETVGLKYRVTVRFLSLLFSGEMSPKTDIMTSDQNGDIIYHALPDVKLNPMMLKCSCPDFRHRFEHELADVDALIGAPRKYKRKTPLWPIGRPYANSTHKVGICKHIHSMLMYLKGKKLLKGAW